MRNAAGTMPAPPVARASCPEPSVTTSCANLTVLGVPPGNIARDPWRSLAKRTSRAFRRMRNAAGTMPAPPVAPATPQTGRQSGPAKSRVAHPARCHRGPPWFLSTPSSISTARPSSGCGPATTARSRIFRHSIAHAHAEKPLRRRVVVSDWLCHLYRHIGPRP
jgi:hypothetical protein